MQIQCSLYSAFFCYITTKLSLLISQKEVRYEVIQSLKEAKRRKQWFKYIKRAICLTHLYRD